MKKYILIFLLSLGSEIGLSQIRYDLNNEQQIAISYTNPKVYEVAEIEVIGEKYLDEVALKSLASIHTRFVKLNMMDMRLKQDLQVKLKTKLMTLIF